MSEIYKAYVNSEIGLVEIAGNEAGILAIDFVENKTISDKNVHPCLKDCVNQIEQYFNGQRTTFSIKLQIQGTDFQKKVWEKMLTIPFGETITYNDIGISLGQKNASRAVGGASGSNKIPIIIPCHRVIGSNGSLTGYGSGVWRKKWLLNHERNILADLQDS